MKVLITGGSGKLGSELANHLSSQGICVSTLGRRSLSSQFRNYSWSLGMTPRPDAFLEVDCLVHLAWATKDRGLLDFHINVGGSRRLFEFAEIVGVKTINLSSLSTLNPNSMYGKAKESVEQSNSKGINLRVAKIEFPTEFEDFSSVEKVVRKLIALPVPKDLNVHVVEIGSVLEEITHYVKGDFKPGTYTFASEKYDLSQYLKKYHGLKSFPIPTYFIKSFFAFCKFSRTRKGRVLHDRWASLVSTDQALRNLSR
jgi:dTDP-4-dehydrorhamnose reductase